MDAIHGGRGGRGLRLVLRGLIGTMVAMGLAVAWFGCEARQPPPAPPGPAFTGPAYLQGTVGSMTKLRGYEPLLVSGYGLVVDLQGTGSADVPDFLRK
ncbi:MAG: hypothetical protein IT440_15295, partial [Phycisphaeraceae bacterium]|nr:hypothetical protein [Phycisphaeraceae bacterium]